MLLRPALERFNTSYVTTRRDFAERDGIARLFVIPDANRHRPLLFLTSVAQSISLMRTIRPDVVISTGALPGLACLLVGRLFGARTIWIDSVANSERISFSGWCARPFTSYWVTQWQHLATSHGAKFLGSLL